MKKEQTHPEGPPQSKAEFLKLQAEWYRRLKEAGFEDIEQRQKRGDESLLREWHSCYFSLRFTPDTFEIQQDYYYYATHFLNSRSFSFAIENELERQIWRLHSEGRSTRDIELILNASKGFPRKKICNKDSVATVINRLKTDLRAFIRDGDIMPLSAPLQLELFCVGE